LTWACRFVTVFVRFWRSRVCASRNCCIAGSIGPCWGALPAGWSTPDPDLVFTIWVLGTLL
jgi:hypothetical protein